MSDSTNSETLDTVETIGTASYSVEDNKLRLYAFQRLDAATYDRVKAAGFKWAPKQDLFVKPSWCPSAEDLLLELCGEIDDEDYSPEERAADRAERFSGYRDKRTAEAVGHADTFEAGPQVFGHQNAARAQRQARRHDRHRSYACNQWSKAEYWQSRTEGVIRNALYKASPEVRRGRIKRLETEQRKHEKNRADYAARFAAWQKVLTLEGATTVFTPLDTHTKADIPPAYRLAYDLANYGCWGNYQHPRKADRKVSLYSLLTDSSDPISPAEAAKLWLGDATEPFPEGCNSTRWSEHYTNRLNYERAMLANEGGTAAEAEIVVGGWICTGNRTGSVFTDVKAGWKQIHAITRSPATKKITSVKVMGMVGYRDPKPGLVSMNVERLAEGDYRAPTPEELETFTKAVATAKKLKKETTPKGPELINPTLAEAQKLQDILNATAKASYDSKKRYEAFTPTKVICMTQKQYSDRSKGSSPACQTGEVSELLQFRQYGKNGRVTVFKIRYASASGFNFYDAPHIIVITDKPQKAIPWEEVQETKESQPNADKYFHLLGEIEKEMKIFLSDFSQNLLDAAYIGWVTLASMSQKTWTPKGLEALKKYKEVLAEGGTPTATGTLYKRPAPVAKTAVPLRYDPHTKGYVLDGRSIDAANAVTEEPAPVVVDGEVLLFA